MPTHGSPAAARQANARARPRAGVSRPAHRPRPAQPSAPAPVQDPALTPPQNPDSYPHISPPHSPGAGVFPCSAHPQQHPWIFANVSLVLFLAWPPRGAPGPVSAALLPTVSCWVQGGKAASLSPHLLLALKQLAPVPGFPLGLCSAGPSHSGSGSTASHPRDPLLKQPPVHCPGTCWPCSPVLDSQLLLLLGMALSFASLVRICLLCWIVSPMN